MLTLFLFSLKKGWGKLFFPAAIISISSIFASCGIPASPYLPPIPTESVESPLTNETAYSFAIPSPDSIIDSIFEGFEIYYKLIPSESSPDYLDDGDPELSSPISLNDLENEGYERIASSIETPTDLPSYPVILLTDAEKSDPSLIITLDFSNSATSVPGSSHGEGISFKRSFVSESGERILKSFTTADFAEDDGDLPPGFDITANFDITIVLYAMSYGNDNSNLILNIRSSATYLGKSLLLLN